MEQVLVLEDYLMNEKIYDLCQSNNGSTEPTILLSKYMFDKELMRDCEVVPFIKRDGKYEWNVEIKSVTVAEYFRTFPCYGKREIEYETTNYCSTSSTTKLQNAKKYFETYMKTTYKEWRDIQCSGKEKRVFFKKIMQYGVSPMSVIQAIYMEIDYYLEDFCRLFSCNKTEGRAILKALGFRNLNVEDYFEKEHSFEKAVLKTCEMAENCAIEMQSGCKIKFKQARFWLVNKLHSFWERQAEKASAHIHCNTERIELAKGERKKSWENVIYVLIIVFMLAFLIWSIQMTSGYLHTMLQAGDYVSWSASASGFYGAIIGGVFSSIATIATTYLVIHRSYKVDYHRERLEVMPVFSAKCFTGKQIEKIKIQYRKANGYGMQIEEHAIYEQPQLILLKNIGNGIAFHIEMRRYPKESEAHYLNTMEPMAQKGVIYENINRRKVVLSYHDLYGNQYIQYIHVYENGGDMLTTAEQPELIVRTKRIRYVQ